MGWREWWGQNKPEWWWRHEMPQHFRRVNGQDATPHALTVERNGDQVFIRLIDIVANRELGWISLEQKLSLKLIENIRNVLYEIAVMEEEEKK